MKTILNKEEYHEIIEKLQDFSLDSLIRQKNLFELNQKLLEEYLESNRI